MVCSVQAGKHTVSTELAVFPRTEKPYLPLCKNIQSDTSQLLAPRDSGKSAKCLHCNKQGGVVQTAVQACSFGYRCRSIESTHVLEVRARAIWVTRGKSNSGRILVSTRSATFVRIPVAVSLSCLRYVRSIELRPTGKTPYSCRRRNAVGRILPQGRFSHHRPLAPEYRHRNQWI